MKLAPFSLLEEDNLSGVWQKVRAGLGIKLYLAARWGGNRSGAGKIKTLPCFSSTFHSRGHVRANEDEFAMVLFHYLAGHLNQ